MSTTLKSYAKINLGLRIGPLRDDGFHSLATVYQTIDLWDRVTVTASPAAETEIVIRANHPWVPADARNTCWKMATLALEAMQTSARVEIGIEKRLPVQGGLGAGSGNAAAALRGLEAELDNHPEIRKLDAEQRLALAARVGSDVPLFVVGGASLGTGRGEIVTPLEDAPAVWCVVAVPGVGVSTSAAFRDWDVLQAEATFGISEERLTASDGPSRLEELSRCVAEVWPRAGSSGVFSSFSSGREGLAKNPILALVRTGIENDFESVVFPQHPLLRDLKLALAGPSPDILEANEADRAAYAALSGSGSALFGLYLTEQAAGAAVKRVEALGAKALLTRTLGRDEV
jgi:4-diphosphocytidyl-2-C-methyl-D-erythritol kinase